MKNLVQSQQLSTEERLSRQVSFFTFRGGCWERRLKSFYSIFHKIFQSVSQEIFFYLPTNTHNRAAHNSHHIKSIKGLNWWDELFIVFVEKALVIKIIVRSTDCNHVVREQKSAVQNTNRKFPSGKRATENRRILSL